MIRPQANKEKRLRFLRSEPRTPFRGTGYLAASSF
jgi:hypothetical protein